MKMSKHTPKPWRWMANDQGPADEDGFLTPGPIDIATFRSPGYYGNPRLVGKDNQEVIGCDEYGILDGATPEERIANAKLLELAPDLLEFVEKIACVGDDLIQPEKTVIEAQSLLSRLG